ACYNLSLEPAAHTHSRRSGLCILSALHILSSSADDLDDLRFAPLARPAQADGYLRAPLEGSPGAHRCGLACPRRPRRLGAYRRRYLLGYEAARCPGRPALDR